jgi:leader peptidase (prepilin peptidase)/N-methyltransferase
MIVASTAIGIWGALVVPATVLLPVTAALGVCLLTLAVIDAECFRLPDVLTLPLIACGLIVAAFLPGLPLFDHVIGAAAGFVVFAALAWLFRRVRGRDALGLGDAKLAAAAGAWLGWMALPSMVLIACVLGFIWIAVRAITSGRQSMREHIAFGVPLAAAFWLVWLYGPLQIFSA